MGCSESSPEREIHSNTDLPNFASKEIRKMTSKKTKISLNYKKRIEILPFAAEWMELVGIMINEISQLLGQSLSRRQSVAFYMVAILLFCFFICFISKHNPNWFLSS